LSIAGYRRREGVSIDEYGSAQPSADQISDVLPLVI